MTASDSSIQSDVKVPFGLIEWLLILLGVLSCVAMVATWVVTWPSVPEKIPPELPINWNERSELMIVPIVGIKLYLITSALAAIPETYNYAWKITPQNRSFSYRLARCFILVFALVPLWVSFAAYLYGVRLAVETVQ